MIHTRTLKLFPDANSHPPTLPPPKRSQSPQVGRFEIMHPLPFLLNAYHKHTSPNISYFPPPPTHDPRCSKSHTAKSSVICNTSRLFNQNKGGGGGCSNINNSHQNIRNPVFRPELLTAVPESQRRLPNSVTVDPEKLLKGWGTQGLGRGHTNNGTNLVSWASAHICQILHSFRLLTYSQAEPPSPRNIPKFSGSRVTNGCGEHMY